MHDNNDNNVVNTRRPLPSEYIVPPRQQPQPATMHISPAAAAREAAIVAVLKATTKPPPPPAPKYPELNRSGEIETPRIIFAPNAYLKYVFMANQRKSDYEVAGYGLHTVNTETGIIYVSEFIVPKQLVTSTHCEPDADDMNDIIVSHLRRNPKFNSNRIMSVWCHTHPRGLDNTPSGTDWDTLAAQSSTDWTAMLIMDYKKNINAHVRQATLFGNVVNKVPVTVDWNKLGDAPPDYAAWQAEYDEKVQLRPQIERRIVTAGESPNLASAIAAARVYNRDRFRSLQVDEFDETYWPEGTVGPSVYNPDPGEEAELLDLRELDMFDRATHNY